MSQQPKCLNLVPKRTLIYFVKCNTNCILIISKKLLLQLPVRLVPICTPHQGPQGHPPQAGGGQLPGSFPIASHRLLFCGVRCWGDRRWRPGGLGGSHDGLHLLQLPQPELHMEALILQRLPRRNDQCRIQGIVYPLPRVPMWWGLG